LLLPVESHYFIRHYPIEEVFVGIRETLNEKPAIAYGGFGVLLLIAMVILFFYMRSGTTGPIVAPKPVGDQAYYSDDDGKNWFPDAIQKATPFPHGGKDAVRAMVYRCSDGKLFCSYLVRHTDAGRQQKGKALEIGRPQISNLAVIEVKKPGGSTWVPVETKNTAKVIETTAVSCPGNPNDVPILVLPGQ
jgi:hypothetical protein